MPADPLADAAREAAIAAMRESLRYRADVPDWLPGHMLDAIPQSVLAALAAASPPAPAEGEPPTQGKWRDAHGVLRWGSEKTPAEIIREGRGDV